MESSLTIQQTAERTGLTTHTLRYYERVGLLPWIGRAANKHRRYTEEDIRMIEFVKRLRSTGMPIVDVQRYVALLQRGGSTVAERLGIMESHRERLVERIEELQGFLARIEIKIEGYRERIRR